VRVATTDPAIEGHLSPLERGLINEQLQRLLASHAFRNSQRYPGLLRYVVEQTLAGNAEQLKERTLGVAVFHRRPDYDTNADPVVRVTAGEVRKRLAQYYQQHPGEYRIELASGSYVPQFQIVSAHAAAARLQESPENTTAAGPVTAMPLPAALRWHQAFSRRSVPYLVSIVAILLCAITIISLLVERSHRRDALYRFWAPLTLAHQSPAFIIGGRMSVYLAGDGTPLPLLSNGFSRQAQVPDPPERTTTISVGDAFSFARVASLLTREGYTYTAASAAQTSLEDLRAHPSVLFGAFNNAWTLHATNQLRYRLGYDKPPGYSHLVWIVDSHNPQKRWMLDCRQPINDASRDYAIVARYFDPEIEQQVVIAAGLRENGTTAAAEFLTRPRYLDQLDNFAPKGGWAHKNMEAVIETEVVGGRSGPPRVVAATFW
jgi:hypothetical protein